MPGASAASTEKGDAKEPHPSEAAHSEPPVRRHPFEGLGEITLSALREREG